MIIIIIDNFQIIFIKASNWYFIKIAIVEYYFMPIIVIMIIDSIKSLY